MESQNLTTRLITDCPADSSILLWSLAHYCEDMWLLGEARFLHERVTAVQAAHPETDGRWAISSLVTLGEMTSKRAGLPHVTNPSTLQDSAVALAERALALARAQFGTSDTMFAYVADRLGDYYVRLGKRAAAYALWDSAWAANRLHLPPEHIELQGNLDRMAGVYRSQGRFPEAETLAKQALDLRRKTRGEGHPEVASMLANLGRIYESAGKYREAEPCLREAIAIREGAIERSIPLIAESYRQLGRLYYDEGKYALADRQFHRAIGMMRDALGEQHGWVASCLRDLAEMYTTWGRVDEALDALNEALAIQSRFLSPAHPSVVATLEEIAQTELMLGHIAMADSAISQALSINQAAVAAGAAPQTSLVTTRARVLLARGMPDAAETLLHTAPLPAGMSLEELCLLAQAQEAQTKFEAAKTTYTQIFTDPLLKQGWNVVAAANAREQYARFLFGKGEFEAALAEARAALDARLAILHEGGQVLSEHQALGFEAAVHRSRDLLLTAYFAAPSAPETVNRQMADRVIASKGAVSNQIFERERGLRSSRDPDILALGDSLHFARRRLATLYMATPREEQTDALRMTLDSVRSVKNGLELRLAMRTGASAGANDVIDGMTEQIRAKLPPASTLIEYIRYEQVGDGRSRYAALVFPDSGGACFRDLGDAALIDSLVTAYQSCMMAAGDRGEPPDQNDLDTYAEIAQAIYALAWGPVAPMIRRGSPVIIAPDAELYLVSFAGLLDEQDRYLIEINPIQYLSCARALLDETASVAEDGALILCDPDFEADAHLRAQSLQSDSPILALVNSASETQTLRSSCADFAKRHFTPLPGTRAEAVSVRRNWSEGGEAPVEMLIGAAASEEGFKRRAPGKSLLHIATHGFFLNRECAIPSYRGSVTESVVGENPLLLSGLCLAGANRVDDTSTSASDDGLLTAEEVASLPLDGVQWVVLSACDTRLGQSRNGEGLFGLQRAFQMAGARTVISSLWPISDRATTTFMRSLYGKTREPLYIAMQQAQLDAIRELRRRGQPDHPYNWAAFVAVGGWLPLD